MSKIYTDYILFFMNIVSRVIEDENGNSSIMIPVPTLPASEVTKSNKINAIKGRIPLFKNPNAFYINKPKIMVQFLFKPLMSAQGHRETGSK